LWRRAAAKLVDLSLLVPSAYLPMALLVAAASVFGYDPFDDRRSRAGSLLATTWLLAAAVGVLVAVLIEMAALTRRGRTRGMTALSLCVVSDGNDSTVTLEQAAIRTVLPVAAAVVGSLLGMLTIVYAGADALDGRETVVVVATAAVSWLVFHLSALLHSDRRGWHDRAAGTAVVGDSAGAYRRGDDEMAQRWRNFLHGQP
jgi:uncharacterized RDD family membrane protein YckC